MIAAFPLLAVVPSWVWATLLMALFVSVSVLVMWAARYPVRRAPPSLRDAAEEREPEGG